MRALKTHLASAAMALALAACGGSSGEPAGPVIQQPDATVVPSSAVASSTALVSYLGSLATSDANEPLAGVTVLEPTRSEVEEPLPIQ